MAKKLSKNKPITEWMKNPKNVAHGLYIIQIGKDRYPIYHTAQTCQICKKGWNAPYAIAIRNNKAYHKKCLKKRNLIDKNVAISKYYPKID